jgi:hypothetical protein
MTAGGYFLVFLLAGPATVAGWSANQAAPVIDCKSAPLGGERWWPPLLGKPVFPAIASKHNFCKCPPPLKKRIRIKKPKNLKFGGGGALSQ